MADREFLCCLCGKEFIGWGHNPWPVDKHPDHNCCDDCNSMFVIPARLKLIYKKKEDKQ